MVQYPMSKAPNMSVAPPRPTPPNVPVGMAAAMSLSKKKQPAMVNPPVTPIAKPSIVPKAHAAEPMTIPPYQSAPAGPAKLSEIKIKPEEIERVRQGGGDMKAADTAYKLDPSFRKVADWYIEHRDELPPDGQDMEKLATRLLNIHYHGTPDLEEADPLTAQLASDAKNPSPGLFTQLKKRFSNAGQAIVRQQSGQQGPGETTFQMLGQSAGGVNDIIGAALGWGVDKATELTPEGIKAPIRETVQAVANSAPGQAVGGALETAGTIWNQYQQNSPRGAANLAAVGNIGSLIPVDAAAGAIARPAAKAIGRAIPKEAFMKAGNNVADRLISNSLELNANQIRKIAKPNIAGVHPSSWLRDHGIIGDRAFTMDALETLSKSSKQALDEGLAKVPGKVTLKESDQALDSILRDIAPDGVPLPGWEEKAHRAALLRALPERSLAQHNEVKRFMDDVLGMYNKTGDGADNVKAEGLRNVRDKLKTHIETGAEKAGFKDVKRLNKDTQVSHEILNALEYTGGELPYTKLIPAIKNIAKSSGAAALGFTFAGPLGSVGAVAIERILSNPKVQTFIARALATYGDDEVKAVTEMLKRGKKTPTAARVMEEIGDDLAEVLKMDPDAQSNFLRDDILAPEERSTGLVGGSDNTPPASNALPKESPAGTNVDFDFEIQKREQLLAHYRKLLTDESGYYKREEVEKAIGTLEKEMALIRQAKSPSNAGRKKIPGSTLYEDDLPF